MPRRKANPQTTPKAVYLSILKAKRSDCDIAERQRKRTKFMLIEYCLVGFKKHSPAMLCSQLGLPGGEGYRQRDSEEEKRRDSKERGEVNREIMSTCHTFQYGSEKSSGVVPRKS